MNRNARSFELDESFSERRKNVLGYDFLEKCNLGKAEKIFAVGGSNPKSRSALPELGVSFLFYSGIHHLSSTKPFLKNLIITHLLNLQMKTKVMAVTLKLN